MNWLRFSHPEFLYLLWGVPPVLAVLIFGIRRKGRDLRRFYGTADPKHLHRYRFQAAVLLLTYLLLTLALAGPQWGAKPEPVVEQLDIMLGLDISTSMLAEDADSLRRLTRAKEMMLSLLDQLAGDRVGLLYFAEASFVVCPLTSDIATLQEFLGAITPETLTHSGTHIGNAIETATQRLLDATQADTVDSGGQKALILFSDGEDHSGAATEAARAATEADIHVYCVGVGTATESAPIPLIDETSAFKRDAGGRLVLTRLDETELQAIAEAGNGEYYPATAGLAGLVSDLARLEKRGVRLRSDGDYQERFQLFVGAALLLLICELLHAAIWRRLRP